jgi:phosphoenolpyruvate synthase/pyruvate phosphate dikinase
MKIFWLGEADCHKVALVGEKAAVLSRLSAAYSVPAGFCLTGAALGQAMEGEAEAWQKTVADGYRALAERWGSPIPTVVVRPSYSGEQKGAQYEPYLANGIEALLAAAGRCFRAARAEQLLTGRPMALASVLVQPLVAADVTVRLHSLNPSSGDQQEVVVEAAWGLPARLMGGEGERDWFVVNKCDLSVVGQTVMDKRQMVLALPGGPREVKVPHFLRQQAALHRGQVVEAASLVLALEEALGRPVTAECAYEGKRLYLLNCRGVRPVVGTVGRAARLVQQTMMMLAL